MSVGLVTVTTGFLTVTTGLSYRNCNLARPLILRRLAKLAKRAKKKLNKNEAARNLRRKATRGRSSCCQRDAAGGAPVARGVKAQPDLFLGAACLGSA